MLEAIDFGHQCCKKIVAGIRELVAQAGKPKMVYTPAVAGPGALRPDRGPVQGRAGRRARHREVPQARELRKIAELKKKVLAGVPEEQQPEAKKVFEALKERIFRTQILDARRRPDGRAFDQIRPISIEVGVLPRVHGSALFTRGETQSLVTVTLGTKDDEQRLELLEIGESSKRFMLHYNFPPFSVGEVGFMRGPGRREIGHGALAERSLTAVIPDESVFPYTMRVVSDILESNGSSSMATVCGATLSLMDAGVPIVSPVAGVAMGLVLEDEKYAVLTDIAGAEDHYGDMDFKVAGTRKASPACRWTSRSPRSPSPS